MTTFIRFQRTPGYACLLLTALTFAYSARAQQANGGAISGVVQSLDGSPLPGAMLSYGRLAPGSTRAMLPPVMRATADSSGRFAVNGLASATYLFCAQYPGGYLDPCHWSSSPPTFTVGAGANVQDAVIRLSKGQQVTVTISDPQHNLASEGQTPGAHLMLGVVAASGAFHQAQLQSNVSGSRTYSVTVPFDVAVNFTLSPGAFQLLDASGAALSQNGLSVKLTAPSAGPAPTLAFTLNGLVTP
jgi:hypothetical protein